MAKRGPRPTDEASRFWSKVEKSDGCWEWKAASSLKFGTHRYGGFKVGGRMIYSHRWAYIERYGPIPEGLTLDHLCRNTICVRPEHLEAVTHRENMLRGKTVTAQNVVKTHCAKGHPYDDFNTYHMKTKNGQGKRFCRACGRERARKWEQARRQVVLEG